MNPTNLGVLLDKGGQTEEAEGWFRRAAATEDPSAAESLKHNVRARKNGSEG